MQEDLLIFLQDALKSYPHDLACVKGAPRFVLEACATNDSEIVRAAIAKQQDLPDDIIDILLQDASVSVVGRLVANKSVHIDKLRPVFDDARSDIRLALSSRIDLPRDVAMRLWATGNQEIRENLLAYGDIDPSIIVGIVLKRSRSADRINVAKRERHLSPELLAALAQDRVADVRCALAYRGDLPAEIALLLAADKEEAVWSALMYNTKLSGDVLHAIVLQCGDNPSYVGRVLYNCGNKAFLPEDIEFFINHSDTSVRAHCALYLKLNPQQIRQMASDPELIVRGKTAGRRDLPEDVAIDLLNDPNPYIVCGVLRNNQFDAQSIDDMLAKTWEESTVCDLLFSTIEQPNLSLSTMYMMITYLNIDTSRLLLHRTDLPAEIRMILTDSD